MTDIILSDNEQVELEKLTKQAQRNATEAQKFSIEAAKILSVTKERLAEYKDRGFFKRCWYAVSGKTSALERANQEDLIKMQRFAWVYLSKLQEQNLIQAKAIAVIRNNLKEVQDEVGELSEQVSVIVDKFDARLCDLEGMSALHDWLLHIKLNDSIDRNTKYICFLQLVFDCLSVIRKSHIGFEKASMRNDIDAVLVEFGIDRDEEMTVDAFVSGLYDEVMKVGMERLKSIIDISVDGEVLPATYMLQSFTGTGCNALYGFENEMERNENVAMQIEDENARNAIRLAAVKAVMTNGNAQFTFSELGREIVGACLIAEDLYRSEHGMDMGEVLGLNEPEADEGFDMTSVLGSCAEIKRHSFLDDNPSEDEKRSYIETFALVFAAMGGFRDSEYLTALAKLFGCEESVECVKNVSAVLRSSPRSVNGQIQNDLKVMKDDQRKYSWALDALMLAGEERELTEKIKNQIKTVMCKAFKLNDKDVIAFIGGAEKVVLAQDFDNLKEGVNAIDRRTNGWLAIADYKGISVAGEIVGKNVIEDQSGNREIIGQLEFEEVKKTPFLPNDISHMVYFKDHWYVVVDKLIWKWNGREEWNKMQLPSSVDFGYHLYGRLRNTDSKLKVLGCNLILISRFRKEIYVSNDGESFERYDISTVLEKFGLGYVQDILECDGRWYLQTTCEKSFQYKSGIVFKTTETGHDDATTFLWADSLEGPWHYEKDRYDFDVGRESVCVTAIPAGLVGVSKEGDWYNSLKEHKSDSPEAICCLDGASWEEASLEGRLYGLSYWWTDNCFVSSFGEDCLLTIAERGVYYSKGGRAWKLVESDDQVRFVSGFHKIGSYYGAFATKGYGREGILYLTKDCNTFIKKECKVCLNKVAFNDNVFLISDETTLWLAHLNMD